MKRGFTLVELIIAMVITALLASVGLQVLEYIYKGYLQTRSITELEAKTQIVLEILGKRLQYRIKPTLAVHLGNNFSNGNYYSLNDATRNNRCNNNPEDCRLVWYKQDYENQRLINSGNGMIQMVWSGVGNMNFNDQGTTQATARHVSFSSPGSSTNGGVMKDHSGLVFKGVSSNLNDFYNIATWTSKSVFDSNNIAGTNNIDFSKPNASELQVSDQYYIADTANEIYVDNCKLGKGCNLNLTYYYRPWYIIDPIRPSSALLAQNVSSFRFTQLGSDGIILKLCMIDPNQPLDKNKSRFLEICKTQAVQ